MYDDSTSSGSSGDFGAKNMKNVGKWLNLFCAKAPPPVTPISAETTPQTQKYPPRSNPAATAVPWGCIEVRWVQNRGDLVRMAHFQVFFSDFALVRFYVYFS